MTDPNTFRTWKMKNNLDASWPYMTPEAIARAIVRYKGGRAQETPVAGKAVNPIAPLPLCSSPDHSGEAELAKPGHEICQRCIDREDMAEYELLASTPQCVIDEDEMLHIAAKVRAKIARETATRRTWERLAADVMAARPSLWDRVVAEVRGHPGLWMVVGCCVAFGVFQVWWAR